MSGPALNVSQIDGRNRTNLSWETADLTGAVSYAGWASVPEQASSMIFWLAGRMHQRE
jgi:hypothetical protein